MRLSTASSRPALIGNNHHETPYPGEDIQIFERDLPGENKAGLSGQSVANHLPLETCETMNGMWGYKIMDQNYKSSAELVRLMVGAAGKGANLLLNIGPQPSGELPPQPSTDSNRWESGLRAMARHSTTPMPVISLPRNGAPPPARAICSMSMCLIRR